MTVFTNPLHDDVAHDSQFPIVGDENRKGASGKGPEMFKGQTNRIRGIDPKAQAIIEGLQPYQTGAAWRRHPLWLLTELSNLDKHRLLHVTSTAFSGIHIEPPPIEDFWAERL